MTPATYSKRMSELPGSFELVLAPTHRNFTASVATAGSSSWRSIGQEIEPSIPAAPKSRSRAASTSAITTRRPD